MIAVVSKQIILGESLRVMLYVPAFFALRDKKELHCDPFRKSSTNFKRFNILF
jgi:hypothetical protein